MSRYSWMTRGCIICVMWATTAVALPAQSPAAVPSAHRPPVVPPAPKFATVYNFTGSSDGATPLGGLVQAANGSLYGTTSADGAGGGGTVFKTTASGTLTTLQSFGTGEGEQPQAGLIQATSGEFYGTTYTGGPSGSGTVFKMTASGALTTLFIFGGKDGALPMGALVQGTDGKFYGTTYAGGGNGGGTVFEITAAGQLTTLYKFVEATDGRHLLGALVEGTDGNFYGTTELGGGSGCSGFGCGTVFKITPGGKLTTIHLFDFVDGSEPEAGLILGTDGNFYGTTEFGGTGGCYQNGCGTAFKITASGTLTTLYRFCSDYQNGECLDGQFPRAPLVEGSDGNFYGTTEVGGSGDSDGTVFQLTPGGTLTTLHSFDYSDGALPLAGLVQDTNGIFYGTTSDGGEYYCGSGVNCGTVFAVSVGLAPFVATNPGAGEVGAKIGILGTDLTGATGVTFSGLTADFEVITKTLIVAEVPSGATMGTVQVQLPGGTLSSNVPFYVLK